MELYIIRHAQSFNNVLVDQRDRVVDPPLTELGERQAEQLAAHLADGWQPVTWSPDPLPPDVPVRGMFRGYGLTRLYCSPMLRSLQTAQPVAEAIGIKPEIWIDIHEQGGMFLEEGEGEARVAVGKPGMTRAEISARFPDYLVPEEITERGWYNGEFEEWALCHTRAARVAARLREWAAADRSQRIAIVSHGGFADALLKALLHGGPVESNGHGPNFFYLHFNTAIDRIDFSPEARLRVSYLNRIEHLSADLLS